jgi:hypothetical protein
MREAYAAAPSGAALRGGVVSCVIGGFRQLASVLAPCRRVPEGRTLPEPDE